MVNQEQVLEILHAIGEKITEEKLFLTELDNVIGDGDHGINLARGFAEVEKKRPMMEGKDIGTMLKTTGMALVSTVGGASGPLYGTAFMQAVKALAGKTELGLLGGEAVAAAHLAGVPAQRGEHVGGSLYQEPLLLGKGKNPLQVRCIVGGQAAIQLDRNARLPQKTNGPGHLGKALGIPAEAAIGFVRGAI